VGEHICFATANWFMERIALVLLLTAIHEAVQRASLGTSTAESWDEFDSKVQYYSNLSVRSRIEEFLGFSNHRDKHASCFFMAIGDSEKTQYLNQFSKRWLPSKTNDLLEISRSLWDR
jgi:hypothetical protein